jgi:hypothetical protein
MVCRELEQLQYELDVADREWAEFRLPQTIEMPGWESLHRAILRRQEALAVRNKAANRLYEHRKCCPRCRPNRTKRSAFG